MQAKSPKIALYTEKQINAPRDMRGVSPVCVYRAWTPSLADRRMPFRFFYVYWLGVGHKRNPYDNGKAVLIINGGAFCQEIHAY